MYNQVSSKSRSYFNTYVKPMVKGNECVFCGVEDDLEVHHKEPLSVTTQKVMEQYQDIDDVSVLSHIVNSQSIKQGLLTLCNKCHTELHEENDDFGRLSTDVRAINRIRRKKKHFRKVEEYLGELHDSGTVFLSRDDREPFINTINYREDGKLRKSLPKINYYLERRKSNYRVEQFKTSRTNNGKRKQYASAWRVVQI